MNQEKEQPKKTSYEKKTGGKEQDENGQAQSPRQDRQEPMAHETEIDLGSGKRDQRFSDQNQPVEGTKDEEAAA